jgi:hypothetical protein
VDVQESHANNLTTVTHTAPKREELEAALAEAEAAEEHLEAELAKAQSALVNTVTDASRIDANREEAQVKVENARARCRQLRAVLANPGHADLITRLRERIDSSTELPGGAPPKQATVASASPDESAGRAVRAEGSESDEGNRQPRTSHRPMDALAVSLHLRRGIGLLVLVLAYLQYYFLDVQLQIVLLPSVTTLAFQQ